MDVTGKQVVVLGLGISGMEAAILLQNHGAKVTVRDNAANNADVNTRAEKLRARGVIVELGEDIPTSTDFALAVLSPGINPIVPLVKTLSDANVTVLSELELAYRFCECPIVAITGTNGKTTTTELIDAVLTAGGKKTTASGNIGTAFSAAVRDSKNLDVMVLEVSSFQLEQITDFRPHVSVHLNLTPDHLDRYKSMAEYESAKWRIFANQVESDFAVVSTSLRLPELKAKKVALDSTGGEAVYQLINGWLVANGQPVLEQSRTNLIGPHNAENMLAALAVADIYEVPREAAIEALCAYKPLPHRLEKVGEVDGVTFINDSKATNIDALEKALHSLHSPVVLLAGGKDKGLDFSGLLPLVREKVKAIILIGQMTEKLFALWNAAVPCFRATTLADAVEQTRKVAKPGDVVLFSPGCSSFDMFRDYEDRGDQFRELIQKAAQKT